MRKISSKSYSNNPYARVNVDFVLNKLCNILSLSFNLLVKGTKALKLYQIYMLKKNLTPLLQMIDLQSLTLPYCKSPLFL